MEERKRLIAYKVWINDILNSEVYKDDSEFPISYIQVDDKKISKVNIIANVVEKFLSEDKNFASITLDDGSGAIRVKTWKEDTMKIENFNVGDIINIIGKPRTYNEESYIIPEVIKKIEDPNFEIVRKLELLKLYGKLKLNGIKMEAKEIKENKVDDYVEEIVVNESSENSRQLIIKLIERLDDGNGANINLVISNSNIEKENVYSIINELLTEGEIFEIKEGFVKLLG
ncbi:hypothetical protein J4455_02725 [Candidatus Woesearchaeota archaeon]|nr:hypothetical protein [Candidatus Woesearchaeota archaeon]